MLRNDSKKPEDSKIFISLNYHAYFSLPPLSSLFATKWRPISSSSPFLRVVSYDYDNDDEILQTKSVGNGGPFMAFSSTPFQLGMPMSFGSGLPHIKLHRFIISDI